MQTKINRCKSINTLHCAGITIVPVSTALPCSREAGGGNRAEEDWTEFTWRIHKIWPPDKVQPFSLNQIPKLYEWMTTNLYDRYRLVPLARMGLHTQTGHDDDPAPTLRQRAIHTKSVNECQRVTNKITNPRRRNKCCYVNTHQRQLTVIEQVFSKTIQTHLFNAKKNETTDPPSHSFFQLIFSLQRCMISTFI